MHELQGKVAVITGASSGIGAATARRLSQEGACVVLAARRMDALDRLKSNLAGRAHAVATDVTDPSDVQNLFDHTVDELGRADIVIPSAGIFESGYLDAGGVRDWDRMVDVNLKGLLHVLASVLPIMKHQGSGHIVGIGSLAGHRVKPGNAVYSGTKYAVRAVLHGLRQELAEEAGIRVSQISPGVVATEFARRKTAAGSDRNWTPLTAEDVAEAVLFAVLSPPHVNVGDLTVYPTAQEY